MYESSAITVEKVCQIMTKEVHKYGQSNNKQGQSNQCQTHGVKFYCKIVQLNFSFGDISVLVTLKLR